MGEKSKRRRYVRRRRRTTIEVRNRERAEQQVPDSDRPPATTAAPIRKGICLSALIYVEGEQPPAENFDPVAIGVLTEALSAALKEDKDGLSMELKKIEVRNDIEQDDEEEEGNGAEGKEEKFQF